MAWPWTPCIHCAVLRNPERATVIGPPRHAFLVGVAPGTGRRHVGGLDGGVRVLDGQDVMTAVAVDAGGDRGIRRGILALDAGLQAAPMAAGPVFRLLVGPRRGVVVPHEADVRVAVPAEAGNQFAGADAAEGGIVAMILEVVELGAAAVAVVAEQALLPMDIAGQALFLDDRHPFRPQWPVLLVALRARVVVREDGFRAGRPRAVAGRCSPGRFPPASAPSRGPRSVEFIPGSPTRSRPGTRGWPAPARCRPPGAHPSPAA